MKKIMSSASKIVLLYIIGILGLIALFAACWSIATNTFSEMSKIVIGIFSTVVTFVCGFYFGYKGESPANTISTTTATTEVKSVEADMPYVGK